MIRRARQRGRAGEIIAGGVAIFFLVSACANSRDSLGEAALTSSRSRALPLKVRVLARYPHDEAAFTQGLVWFRGKLFESTGLRGQSTLRRIDLETGATEQSTDLAPHLFGEGLAGVEMRLFQLTYRAGEVIVYDVDSLQPVDRFEYSGEGWGLCFDGRSLFMSDGSATLTVRDPTTFEPVRRVTVHLNGRALEGLNELECAEGWIYANIYQTDTIVRVDRETGGVRAVVDASGLLTPHERRSAGVLNGIAYNRESETFLLTGKNWPAIFEVVLTEDSAPGHRANPLELRP